MPRAPTTTCRSRPNSPSCWQGSAVCCAAALAASFPLSAAAQSSAELLNELRALRDKGNQLEKRLQETEDKPAAAPAPGMTPEQQQEFNRIAHKAESLEDTRDALGLKAVKRVIGHAYDVIALPVRG